MDEFKIEILAEKRKADELYSMLVNANATSLGIPAIPVSAVKDFLEGNREDIWEVVVNDKAYLTVTADRPSAAAFLEMLEDTGDEEFEVHPLPAENLRAYVQGQRSTVATLQIRKETRVVPQKESD